MARPRKWYVCFIDGQAAHVVEGRLAALRYGSAILPHATRHAAEERAAWWNYDHVPWWLSAPRDKAARPAATT